MIPGTIPRNKSQDSRRENTSIDSSNLNFEAPNPTPRQYAADSAKYLESTAMTRREYFRSLLPRFGKILVSRLRQAELIKMEMQEYWTKKP